MSLAEVTNKTWWLKILTAKQTQGCGARDQGSSSEVTATPTPLGHSPTGRPPSDPFKPGKFPTADVNASEVTSGPQPPQIVPGRSRCPAPTVPDLAAAKSTPRGHPGEWTASSRGTQLTPRARSTLPAAHSSEPLRCPPEGDAGSGRGHPSLGREHQPWSRRSCGEGAVPGPVPRPQGPSSTGVQRPLPGAQCPLHRGGQPHPRAASPPLGCSLIPGRRLPSQVQPTLPGAQSPFTRGAVYLRLPRHNPGAASFHGRCLPFILERSDPPQKNGRMFTPGRCAPARSSFIPGRSPTPMGAA